MKVLRIFLCISLFACPLQLRAEPVKIGVLTDLSGGMAAWGRQASLGAQIAQDEIGANGGDLSLVVEDHQLQAKKAVDAFRKLTDIDKVNLIYSEFTPTTLAIAPLTKGRRTLTIYAAAAASALAASPYVFKTYLDYIQGCSLVGEYWRRQGIRTVGMLKSTMEFGELCAEGLKKTFPDAIEVEYTPGDPVATQVLALKSKNVQAVANAAFLPDFLRMARGFNDLGWKPNVASQSDAITRETYKQFPALLENLVVFALPTLPREFIEKVKAKDPSNDLVSISAAGLAYLHVKQLYRAKTTCGIETAECMLAALESSPPDAVTGFKRWKSRVAEFDLRLHYWKNGQEIELSGN